MHCDCPMIVLGGTTVERKSTNSATFTPTPVRYRHPKFRHESPIMGDPPHPAISIADPGTQQCGVFVSIQFRYDPIHGRSISVIRIDPNFCTTNNASCSTRTSGVHSVDATPTATSRICFWLITSGIVITFPASCASTNSAATARASPTEHAPLAQIPPPGPLPDPAPNTNNTNRPTTPINTPPTTPNAFMMQSPQTDTPGTVRAVAINTAVDIPGRGFESLAVTTGQYSPYVRLPIPRIGTILHSVSHIPTTPVTGPDPGPPPRETVPGTESCTAPTSLDEYHSPIPAPL